MMWKMTRPGFGAVDWMEFGNLMANLNKISKQMPHKTQDIQNISVFRKSVVFPLSG